MTTKQTSWEVEFGSLGDKYNWDFDTPDGGIENLIQFIRQVESSSIKRGLEISREVVEEKVNDVWEFLEDTLNDTMANRMYDGRPFLNPKELEKAKQVLLPIINNNILDALSQSKDAIDRIITTIK